MLVRDRKPARRFSTRCYGCSLYFTPGETRSTEVLCPRCARKPEVEMLDVYGLPRVFQGSRMSRQAK